MPFCVIYIDDDLNGFVAAAASAVAAGLADWICRANLNDPKNCLSGLNGRCATINLEATFTTAFSINGHQQSIANA